MKSCQGHAAICTKVPPFEAASEECPPDEEKYATGPAMRAVLEFLKLAAAIYRCLNNALELFLFTTLSHNLVLATPRSIPI